MNEKKVWVSTVLSSRTFEGLVQVTWGIEQDQMNPETARQLARQLLQGADAAEMDEALFLYAKGIIELEDEGAAGVVRDFREFRMRVMERNVKAAVPPNFSIEGGEA